MCNPNALRLSIHLGHTRGAFRVLRPELPWLPYSGTYKIPTANDIPVDLRVTLLKDAPNGHTPLAHSSKAIGEPPFFLGAAVFFALKVIPRFLRVPRWIPGAPFPSMTGFADQLCTMP